MTKEDLYLYLDDPTRLSERTLPQLERLVEVYPYAGGVVFLYLYNLFLIKDLRYPSELRRLAIRLPSRELLYGIAEKSETFKHPLLQAKDREDSFALIDQFLKTQEREKNSTGSEVGGVLPTEDYFASYGISIKADQRLEPPESDTTESEFKALSSSDDRHTLAPSKKEKNLQDREEEQIGDFLPHSKRTENLTKKKTPEYVANEDTFFTETLGRIYAKQGRFDKALAVFEVIAVKNSEKSAYFAEQVRYLQLLVENNKKEHSS